MSERERTESVPRPKTQLNRTYLRSLILDFCIRERALKKSFFTLSVCLSFFLFCYKDNNNKTQINSREF